jgi:cysteine desulfuration protein SufE
MRSNLLFLTELDNWSNKYEALMDFGQELTPLEQPQKNSVNKVQGCQSRVWLQIEVLDSRICINGEADSRLVQGLVAIVVEIYNNMSIEEYKKLPPGYDSQWLSQLGLDTNLSMIRRNGLDAILKKVKNTLAVC